MELLPRSPSPSRCAPQSTFFPCFVVSSPLLAHPCLPPSPSPSLRPVLVASFSDISHTHVGWSAKFGTPGSEGTNSSAAVGKAATYSQSPPFISIPSPSPRPLLLLTTCLPPRSGTRSLSLSLARKHLPRPTDARARLEYWDRWYERHCAVPCRPLCRGGRLGGWRLSARRVFRRTLCSRARYLFCQGQARQDCRRETVKGVLRRCVGSFLFG